MKFKQNDLLSVFSALKKLPLLIRQISAIKITQYHLPDEQELATHLLCVYLHEFV